MQDMKLEVRLTDKILANGTTEKYVEIRNPETGKSNEFCMVTSHEITSLDTNLSIPDHVLMEFEENKNEPNRQFLGLQQMPASWFGGVYVSPGEQAVDLWTKPYPDLFDNPDATLWYRDLSKDWKTVEV